MAATSPSFKLVPMDDDVLSGPPSVLGMKMLSDDWLRQVCPSNYTQKGKACVIYGLQIRSVQWSRCVEANSKWARHPSFFQVLPNSQGPPITVAGFFGIC